MLRNDNEGFGHFFQRTWPPVVLIPATLAVIVVAGIGLPPLARAMTALAQETSQASSTLAGLEGRSASATLTLKSGRSFSGVLRGRDAVCSGSVLRALQGDRLAHRGTLFGLPGRDGVVFVDAGQMETLEVQPVALTPAQQVAMDSPSGQQWCDVGPTVLRPRPSP